MRQNPPSALARSCSSAIVKQYNAETAKSASSNDVRVLIYTWFSYSDRMAGSEDYLPLMSEDVCMVFPEITLNSRKAFVDWRNSTSAGLAVNSHQLSPITVARVDSRHWLASFDIDWHAFDAKHKPIHRRIHQNWWVEGEGDLLVMKRRETDTKDVVASPDWAHGLPDPKLSNENDVKRAVFHWFAGFDRQTPSHTLTSFVPDKVEMYFPGTPIHSKADFLQWYDGVKKDIFWNAHEIQALTVKSVKDKRWQVALDVRWMAQSYEGKLHDVVVHQDWTIKYDYKGELMLVKHHAENRATR